MKKTINYILIAILALLCIFTAWKAYTLKDKIETVTVTDTIRLSDTIVNWQSDTVYFNRYDTVNTTDIVIINDTVNDTTYIQLPIYTYIYDTTITDTTYRTNLKAVVSGFQCQMDSLYLSTQIKPQKVQITPKKWYKRLCPAVGIGFGTGGGFGVFGGIGYEL
ncbi:MAG: hypothetical protein II670_13930 [Alphaproteobacteria bacterium]|nr:hypothetical protein [Alphaproteobacteria bacterium]